MTQHTNLYATQPEALRLADALDRQFLHVCEPAAAELRRLHTINAQLLEALEDYAQYGMSQKARAAIDAAAKGEA